MAPDGVRIAHVDDIEGVPGQHYVEGEWKPVRAELGIDAFGANAYVADAGQLIVEEHDELDEEDTVTADAAIEEPREPLPERPIEEPTLAAAPEPAVEPDSSSSARDSKPSTAD